MTSNSITLRKNEILFFYRKMLYSQKERRDSMLNQVVLVGRIVKTPELRTTENGKKTATVTLAVPRNYKNMNGEYETDFLDCTLWTNVAENTTEYCQTGDMVGVKGRIQTRVITTEDGNKKKKTEIVAEKVTFLAQSPTNKESKEKKTSSTTKKTSQSIPKTEK